MIEALLIAVLILQSCIIMLGLYLLLRFREIEKTTDSIFDTCVNVDQYMISQSDYETEISELN